MEHLKKHSKKHFEKYFTKSLKYNFKGATIRGLLQGLFQGALHGGLKEVFDTEVHHKQISLSHSKMCFGSITLPYSIPQLDG